MTTGLQSIDTMSIDQLRILAKEQLAKVRSYKTQFELLQEEYGQLNERYLRTISDIERHKGLIGDLSSALKESSWKSDNQDLIDRAKSI